MSTLKLSSDTLGGSVTLAAPTTASDITVTLPTTTGTLATGDATSTITTYASVSAIPAGFVGTARIGTDLYVGDGSIITKSNTGLLTTYLGQVATNCRILVNYFASYWLANCRTAHVACELLTNFKVVWPTFYFASGVESNFNGNVTLEATVEYPLNTFTRVTFSGVNKATVTGGNDFLSDFISVKIPANAMFWLRTRLIIPNAAPVGYVTESGTGIGAGGFSMATSVYGSSSDSGAECAEFLNTASTLTSKLTTSGLFGSQGAGLVYRPSAIIQQTTRPTYYISGDSIAIGQYDVLDSNTRSGYLERATKNACINVAVGGESFGNIFVAPKRIALSQYCSHIITNYGINSAGSGASYWTSGATTMFNLFPNKPFYFVTLINQQQTTSNSWVDGGNSATPTNETNRISINNLIRTMNVAGVAGYIDSDFINSASFNGAYWKPSMTSDGTHPNALGNRFLGANLKMPV